mmetsp:Transcript_87229/g.154523  ORF Transcript_87229/g.154523 Transcript_87229/m.154523 type:complete len:83 (+) Transcript_87229:2365-2613(+)
MPSPSGVHHPYGPPCPQQLLMMATREQEEERPAEQERLLVLPGIELPEPELEPEPEPELPQALDVPLTELVLAQRQRQEPGC